MSYLTLPWGSRFHEALSDDDLRPAMTNAMLREREGVWELVGTDSYMLAIVRLELHQEKGHPVAGPVAGPISKKAIEAIVETGAFRATADAIHIFHRDGRPTGVTFQRPQDSKYPNVDALWSGDEVVVTLGIDAAILKRLADSFGEQGLELQITKADGPIAVRPLVDRRGEPSGEHRGLIMPIKLVGAGE